MWSLQTCRRERGPLWLHTWTSAESSRSPVETDLCKYRAYGSQQPVNGMHKFILRRLFYCKISIIWRPLGTRSKCSYCQVFWPQVFCPQQKTLDLVNLSYNIFFWKWQLNVLYIYQQWLVDICFNKELIIFVCEPLVVLLPLVLTLRTVLTSTGLRLQLHLPTCPKCISAENMLVCYYF